MDWEQLTSIDVAADYIERVVGEPREHYQFGYEGIDPQTGLHVVSAAHQNDRQPQADPMRKGAGSGLSMRLIVDAKAQQVTEALHAQ